MGGETGSHTHVYFKQPQSARQGGTEGASDRGYTGAAGCNFTSVKSQHAATNERRAQQESGNHSRKR